MPSHAGLAAAPDPARAPSVAIPETVPIPGGAFVRGSNRAEREAAYRLDESAYGHSITREQRWYENEGPRRIAMTDPFRITRTPITNRQYAPFVRETGHPAPDVDAATWASYGLIHPWARTRRHAWRDGRPPPGREDHPVVLVSWEDARAYARWLGRRTGDRWRLPREAEWEKAARGSEGRAFPWGDEWRPQWTNTGATAPGAEAVMAVGSFPRDRSPYGVMDMGGNVSEWVADHYAPYPGSELRLDEAERAHRVVRGGGAGVGHYSLSLFFRSARRAHADPAMRSTDVGFRCARDVD